jgi:hypothetical protein
MEANMRTASKTFWIIIAASAVIATATAKEKLVNSTWCATPLRIDGTNNDWQRATLTFEKKVQSDFAFMNDADYLYVLFIFNDPQYLSSIEQTGMTVYFNVAGKKKKDYGVRFLQNKISARQYIAMLEKREGTLSEAEKDRILSNPDYMIYDFELINKKAGEKAAKPPSDAKPAIYRIHQDKGKKIAFEMAVPLAKVAELAPGIGTEPGKIIKVGFEWGGLTEAMKKARMERFKSQSERAAESVSETPAGGTSASMARRRRTPKKYDFWVDVKLADKQKSP